jgi:hypothetical protein
VYNYKFIRKSGLFLVCWLSLSILLAACGEETGNELPLSSLQNEAINLKNSKALVLDNPRGEINLSGTGGGGLQGSIEYNVSQLKPVIEGTDTDSVKIRQSTGGTRLPTQGLVNRWDLQLGNAGPLDLNATIGVGNINISTGNTQLSRVFTKINNGFLDINFEKQQTALTQISAEIANGGATYKGLANTASPTMNIKVGNGNLTLDFSQGLNAPLTASGGVGNGNITFIVPSGLGVRVSATITTGNFSGPGFTRQGSQTIYTNAEYSRGGNILNLNLQVSNGDIKVLIK